MSKTNNQSTTEETYRAYEELRPTITVGRESLPIAIRHGMELWWDGSTPTKRLDDRDGSSQFTRFVNSRIEGKLAEVAFMNLLEEYFDLRSAVDWRIYGDYEITDDGDLQYLLDDDNNHHELGVDFDLKKTKPWNSWLAVRDEIFNKIDDDAPVVLSKLRIESDIQVDEWEDAGSWDDVDQNELFRDRLLQFADNEFPLQVEFVGSAYKDEFTDSFDQGQHLYDPTTGGELGPPLKRPNQGIHVDDLDSRPSRWNRIVAEIVGDGGKEMWRPLTITDE